jgi:signal transduction histidine kinase
MSDDPRSVGVPAGHPPINSFLGVPLEVRNEIYGHLYLADPRTGAYTAEDQVLVEALATTAGVAIAHARLFEESTRREQWTAATTAITHELLTNDDVDALQLIAERVMDLAAASLVAVVLTHGTDDPDGLLVVDRATGTGSEGLLGAPLPAGDHSVVRRCLRTQRPQLMEQLEESALSRLLPKEAVGPAMAVPLPADVGVRGSLFVLRAYGDPQFTEFDLDIAASLAGHAALALDRADARLAMAHLRTLEDRDRIARDLHDHVVQRLFAAGLNIQSVCGALGPGTASDRLSAQVDEIDATIRQIRTTIFGLNDRRQRAGGLRSQILSAASAATAALSEPPEVTFRGPLDVLVPESIYADAVAVVREALTNVGRHAGARHVGVVVSADPRELRVEVVDDGRGIDEDVVLSGLDNLSVRARDLGGSFALTSRSGPGTRLLWVVPLDNVPAPSR